MPCLITLQFLFGFPPYFFPFQFFFFLGMLFSKQYPVFAYHGRERERTGLRREGIHFLRYDVLSIFVGNVESSVHMLLDSDFLSFVNQGSPFLVPVQLDDLRLEPDRVIVLYLTLCLYGEYLV